MFYYLIKVILLPIYIPIAVMKWTFGLFGFLFRAWCIHDFFD